MTENEQNKPAEKAMGGKKRVFSLFQLGSQYAGIDIK